MVVYPLGLYRKFREKLYYFEYLILVYKRNKKNQNIRKPEIKESEKKIHSSLNRIKSFQIHYLIAN